MLLIPLDKPVDWKSPPLVTAFLILLNTLIFFVAQAHDDQRMAKVMEYYAHSRLPRIEVPLYLSFLENSGQENHARELSQNLERNPGMAPELLFAMDINAPFMRQLRQGGLFQPDFTERALWQAERAHLDALLDKVVWYAYGLKPAYPSFVTIFSHMFLHADFGHLLGNMLILGLIGYVVETAMSSQRYLFSYLLAGLASGGLSVLIHPDSGITGIGASGAIAGVMGMYAVLFGWRKIRFFYWVVFYFDYIKAPAIIMLPVWLANEFYQMFLAGPTRVNNLAHVGGLCAGAAIAMMVKRTQRGVDVSYLDESEKETSFKRRYAEGIKRVAALDMPQAARIFSELHAEKPDDRSLLVQRYNIAKLSPASDLFHALTHQILNLTDKDAECIKLQNSTYNEYFRIAQPDIRWTPAMLLSLARRFATAGFLDDAENILKVLGKSPIEALAPALLTLGAAYARDKQIEKSRQYLTWLIDRHPQSSEAELAHHILRNAG